MVQIKVRLNQNLHGSTMELPPGLPGFAKSSTKTERSLNSLMLVRVPYCWSGDRTVRRNLATLLSHCRHISSMMTNGSIFRDPRGSKNVWLRANLLRDRSVLGPFYELMEFFY